jgi:hypothetical protein
VSKPKAEGEYVRKHKYQGLTAESEAKRLANLRNAPPAPENNTRAGTATGGLVRSKQPGKLFTADGGTIADTRALVSAALENAATNKPAFEPFAELLATQWHHVRVCEPHVGQMSIAAQRVHLRRVKLVASMFAEAGLTVTAAQALGLMNAKEQEARVKTVRPVRTPERAREVANLLQQMGAIPSAETVIEADVVEDAEPQADYGDPEPAPLSASDQRDLNVRSIFDR